MVLKVSQYKLEIQMIKFFFFLRKRVFLLLFFVVVFHNHSNDREEFHKSLKDGSQVPEVFLFGWLGFCLFVF